MNGMVPSPIPVVIHFRVVGAMRGATLARPNSEAAQIRLMVKPGMMTEARALKEMSVVVLVDEL